MSQFKLDLEENEKDIFTQVFLVSDDYKVVLKIMNQLLSLQEQAVLSLNQDGSEQKRNELMCAKIEMQGAKKLINRLIEIRSQYLKKSQS